MYYFSGNTAGAGWNVNDYYQLSLLITSDRLELMNGIRLSSEQHTEQLSDTESQTDLDRILLIHSPARYHVTF